MEEESKNLLPTVDVPDFVDEEEDEEYDVDYKPSPMWDLEKGDFVRTAANNVPMNDGYEAYKIWCVKTVSTERYSCLGYSDDHGTETEDITRESDQSTVELSLERTIQEALMVNPRTSSVEEFSFEWGTGRVKVSFIVYSVDGEPFEACKKRPWLCGFALWEWAPKLPSASEAWKDDSYEICEKPVQEIIKRFYEHEAGTSLM